MLRKHHSNQVYASLSSEIRKEFVTYFNRVESALGIYISAHPKAVFRAMLIVMAVSLVISFTVLRDQDKRKHSLPHPAEILPERKSGQGFSAIIAAGAALKQTVSIKNEIDSILAKKQLSAKDSLRIGKALDSLDYLRKNLK